MTEALEEAIELVEHDMDALGCRKEVVGLRDIFRDGTSADQQITLYAERITQGDSRETALAAVVDCWRLRAPAAPGCISSRTLTHLTCDWAEASPSPFGEGTGLRGRRWVLHSN